MFENNELKKALKKIKDLERIEENRQLQKQNIITIERLERVNRELQHNNDRFRKAFSEEVSVGVNKELRKLLSSYGTTPSRFIQSNSLFYTSYV